MSTCRWGRIALAALGVAGCSGEPERPAQAPERPAKLMLVTASADVRSVSLPAVVDASATAQLAFPLAGLLAAVVVREGDSVDEGAEIARLDQRDLRSELATAQANFDAAASDFRRTERLLGEGAISRAEYEQRETKQSVTRAALNTARKRIEDSVLRAPFAGVVAEVHAEAFQNVAAQQSVATLQSTGAAEAVVQVPATLVAQSGRIEPVQTTVVLDAAPETPIPAVLHSVAARADPKTRTFEAHFAFTPPGDLVILPGMTGTVHVQAAISGNDDASRITVPIEAILNEDDAHYVWVVDPQAMTVTKRAVILSEGVGETLPVRSGLVGGETIVVAGVSYLHEGMRIRRLQP